MEGTETAEVSRMTKGGDLDRVNTTLAKLGIGGGGLCPGEVSMKVGLRNCLRLVYVTCNMLQT